METINHEYYVSPEVAKLLKEAGFDREVNHSYPNVSALDNSCSGYMEDLHFYHNLNDGKYGGMSAPTLEVAQRWLREVKGIHICVKADAATTNCKYFVTVIISDAKWGNVQDENKKTILFNTYEESQEAGIKKALEIILDNFRERRIIMTREDFYHSRPMTFLQRLVSIGYVTCGCCGMPWNFVWKHGGVHNIRINKYEGFFPVCEYCWTHKSYEQNKSAVTELIKRWKEQGGRCYNANACINAFENDWNKTHNNE